MLALSQLNDDEIANILTYVLNGWGNSDGTISSEEVTLDAICVRKIAALLGHSVAHVTRWEFQSFQCDHSDHARRRDRCAELLMGQADPELLEALVKIPNGQRKVGGTE